jgi:hypothetical protein
MDLCWAAENGPNMPTPTAFIHRNKLAQMRRQGLHMNYLKLQSKKIQFHFSSARTCTRAESPLVTEAMLRRRRAGPGYMH